MKSLVKIIALLLPLVCHAQNEFADIFEMQPVEPVAMADSITQYYIGKRNLNTDTALQQLISYNNTIDKNITQSPKDPGLYFLKGLNLSLLSSLYAKQGNALAPQALKNKLAAYKKAIELDSQTSPKLSAFAYATMKHGLPESLKIKAIQKELKLGGSGDNESQYWYLHWSNINSLQKAGRFQEAQAALNNMKRELKASGIENSAYSDIASRAEHNLNAAIKQQQKNSPARQDQAQETHSSLDTKTLVIIIISIVSLLSILGVTLYERVIKKAR